MKKLFKSIKNKVAVFFVMAFFVVTSLFLGTFFKEYKQKTNANVGTTIEQTQKQAIQISTSEQLKNFLNGTDTYGVLTNDIVDFSTGVVGSNLKLAEGKTLDGTKPGGGNYKITILPNPGGGSSGWPIPVIETIANNGLKNLDNKSITENTSIDIQASSLFLTTNKGTIKNIDFVINGGSSYLLAAAGNHVLSTFGIITGFNFGTIENCSLDLSGDVKMHKDEAGDNNAGKNGFDWISIVGGFSGISCGTIKNVKFTNNGIIEGLCRGWDKSLDASKYQRGAKIHVGGIAGAMYGGEINGVQIYGNGSLMSIAQNNNGQVDFSKTTWYLKNCGYVVGTTSNKSDGTDWSNETTFSSAVVPEGTVSNVYIDATIDVPAFTVSWCGKGSPEYKGGYVVGDVSEKATGDKILDNVNNIIITSESGAKNDNRKNDIFKITAPESDNNPNPKKHLQLSRTLVKNVSFAEDGKIMLELNKPTDKENQANTYFHSLREVKYNDNQVAYTTYATFANNNETTANCIIGENRSSYTIIPYQVANNDARVIDYELGKFYSATHNFQNKTKVYDALPFAEETGLKVSYNVDQTADVTFANSNVQISTTEYKTNKNVGVYDVKLEKIDTTKDWAFYRDTGAMGFELYLIDMPQTETYQYEITQKQAEYTKPQNQTIDYDGNDHNLIVDVTNKIEADDVQIEYCQEGKTIHNADTYILKPKFIGVDAGNYKFATDNEPTVTYIINKINPTVKEWAPIEVAYSPTQKLEDIPLVDDDLSHTPGVWAWSIPTAKPTVNQKNYLAVFTPEDTINYNVLQKQLTVNVSQIAPNIKVRPVFTEVVNFDPTVTLEKFDLTQFENEDGHWIWADKNQVLEVKNNKNGYVATFKPSDATNYTEINENIIITVAAILPDITEVPVVETLTYDGVTPLNNNLLSNHELNTRGIWTWKEEYIPTVENNGYVAVFTPTWEDGSRNENFQVVERTLDVTVLPSEVQLDISQGKIFSKQPINKSMFSFVAYFGTIENVVSGEFVVKLKAEDENTAIVSFTPSADETNYKFTEKEFALTYTNIKVTFQVVDKDDEVKETYYWGSVVPPVDPERNGYTFEGWYTGEQQIIDFTNIVDDFTVIAKFVPINYNIIVDLDGGKLAEGVVIPETYNIESSEIVLPISEQVVKENYVFVGWTMEGVDGYVTSIPTGSTEEKHIKAVYQIAMPSNVIINGYTEPVTYNGKAVVTLTVSHDKVEGFSYSYVWFKGESELGLINESISLTQVADQGLYSVKVIVNDDKQTIANEKVSEAVNVVINQATIEITYNGETSFPYIGKDIVVDSGASTNIEGVLVNYSNNTFKEAAQSPYKLHLEVVGTDNYVGATKDIDITVFAVPVTVNASVKEDVVIFEKQPLDKSMFNVSAYFTEETNIVEGDFELAEKEGDSNIAVITFTPQSSNFVPTTVEVALVREKIAITFVVDEQNQIVLESNYGGSVTPPTNPEKKGYTFDGWFDQALLVEVVEFNNLTANNTVYAKFTIINYDIIVSNDGSLVPEVVIPGQYTVEDAVILPTLEQVVRENYTFLGWKNTEILEGDYITEIPVGSTGVVGITAIFSINAPTNVAISGYTEPVKYTGNVVVTLTVSHDKVGGMQYSYAWYKDNEPVDLATTESISLTNVAQQGLYTVQVTVSDTVLTNSTVSLPVDVQIIPKEYLDPVEIMPFDSVKYSETLTLKDMTFNPMNEIDGKLSWKNPDAKLAIGDNNCIAVFTPYDTNYKSKEVETVINVVKGEPTIQTPEFSVVYDPNKTLNDLVFTEFDIDGKWTWDNPETVPVVVNSGYAATFTPTDSEHYNVLKTTVVVNVSKADFVLENYPTFTVDFSETQTLNDLGFNPMNEIDGTWAWEDSTIKPTVAVKTYNAIFTPFDENYNEVKASIEVTVNPIEWTRSVEIQEFTDIKYTETLTLSDLEFNPMDQLQGGELTWKDGTIVPEFGTNTYFVIFTPEDENYTSTKVMVNVTVIKGDFDLKQIPEFNVVYDPNKDLSSLSFEEFNIDGKWTWNNPETIPEVENGGFGAKFTPTNQNFNVIEKTIVVNVEKADFVLTITPEFADGVEYTETNVLSSLDISQYNDENGQWTWVNPQEKLTSQKEYYSALFTPTNQNFNQLNKDIKVVVLKKPVEIVLVEKDDENSQIHNNLERKFIYGEFDEDFYKLKIDETLLEIVKVEWWMKKVVENNNVSSKTENFEWVKVLKPVDAGTYKLKFVVDKDYPDYELTENEYTVIIEPVEVTLVWENLKKPVKKGEFLVKCYYEVNNERIDVEIETKPIEPGKYTLKAIQNNPNYVFANPTAEIEIKSNSKLPLILGLTIPGGLIVIGLATLIPIIVRKKKTKEEKVDI